MQMRKRWRMSAVVAVVAVALTGCVNGGDGMTPTGDELVAQAKQHYLDYRSITNDVQALIYDGPWEAEIGSFGIPKRDEIELEYRGGQPDA